MVGRLFEFLRLIVIAFMFFMGGYSLLIAAVLIVNPTWQTIFPVSLAGRYALLALSFAFVFLMAGSFALWYLVRLKRRRPA